MQSGQVRVIQVLRAAACLLVVAYHAANAVYPSSWPNGAAGVDLFFVISGFVMVRSSRKLAGRQGGWRVFLWRRACRILPLYWLLTAGKLAISWIRPSLTSHTHPIAASILGSFLLFPVRDGGGDIRPVLPVGWTLEFEAFFYVLFAIALWRHWPPLAITPVLAAAALIGFWRNEDWPAPFLLANGLTLEFAFGLALASIPRLIPARALAPAILLGSFIVLLAAPSCGPWRFLFWGMPAAGIVGSALALEDQFRARIPALLLTIGDASYAIYLVHPFVVPALAPHGVLPAVLSVPLSVAAGCAVHRCVDAPLQRLFSSAAHRSRGSLLPEGA